MKRWLLIIVSLLYSTFLMADPASPLPMLESTSSQMLSALKQNKAKLKSNPKIINQVVERFILPKVDVAGMSRSVLGRKAWLQATTEERAEFSKVFTQLVIRTYANPLAQYSDETIKFLPLKDNGDSRFKRVTSFIYRSKGNTITLHYSLVNLHGQWKIYDLSVEGVSLLQSFRSQFSQALQQSDLKTIINALKQREQGAS